MESAKRSIAQNKSMLVAIIIIPAVTLIIVVASVFMYGLLQKQRQNSGITEALVAYGVGEYENAFKSFSEVYTNPVARFYLGYMYYNGYGVERNYDEAYKLFAGAAEEYENAAVGVLLCRLYGNGTAKDIGAFDEMVTYSENNALAKKLYADCLQNGYLCDQDLTAAYELYVEAEGDLLCEADYSLAQCCMLGLGTKKDYTAALGWLERGMERGSSLCMILRAYYMGDAEGVNTLEAFAEERNPLAAYYLAELLLCGQSVGIDEERAIELFEFSAERGIVPAQIRLAALYYEGFSLDADKEDANVYFVSASKHAPVFSEIFQTYSMLKAGDYTFAHAKAVFEEHIDCPYAQLFLAVSCVTMGETEEERAYGAALCAEAYDSRGSALAAAALGEYYYNKSDYVAAEKWFTLGAAAGSARCEYRLAMYIYEGVLGEKNIEAALARLSSAYSHGSAEAAYTLGNMFFEGKDVSLDYYAAFDYYSEAARKGLAQAQYAMYVCYHEAKGVAENGAAAIEWLMKAAEQKYADAVYALGYCNYFGVYITPNYDDAAYYFSRAAADGNPLAQYYLGECYIEGKGVLVDFDEAFAWFEKAAAQNLPLAQLRLGRCYYDGKGVEKDYAKAFSLFELAANGGASDAEFYLGMCCYNGAGTNRDYVRAIMYLIRFAEEGNTDAMYYVGSSYYVLKDFASAMEWLLAASNGNDVRAMHLAGYIYYYGNGIEKDEAAAFSWFLKAAESGYAPAQYNVGQCYESGMCGMIINLDKAKEWYGLAAEQGSEEAAAALDRLGA